MSTADELRSIRARLEIDSANVNALTNEVRQRTRKLEDDHRMTVRTAKAHGSVLERINSSTNSCVSSKRPPILVICSSTRFDRHLIRSEPMVSHDGRTNRRCDDCRLTEYRDVLVEIKSRLDFERDDRRLVEGQLASK